MILNVCGFVAKLQVICGSFDSKDFTNGDQ